MAKRSLHLCLQVSVRLVSAAPQTPTLSPPTSRRTHAQSKRDCSSTRVWKAGDAVKLSGCSLGGRMRADEGWEIWGGIAGVGVGLLEAGWSLTCPRWAPTTCSASSASAAAVYRQHVPGLCGCHRPDPRLLSLLEAAKNIALDITWTVTWAIASAIDGEIRPFSIWNLSSPPIWISIQQPLDCPYLAFSCHGVLNIR